ncbi:MAG: hypothetical protein HRU32_00230 [Rhodobacteraceae bacterium]|nr:hypothetical protein [Paracoccaceae bacterium]
MALLAFAYGWSRGFGFDVPNDAVFEKLAEQAFDEDLRRANGETPALRCGFDKTTSRGGGIWAVVACTDGNQTGHYTYNSSGEQVSSHFPNAKQGDQ